MHYATLELNGEYQEIGAQAVGLLGVAGRGGFRFDHFYERVERILASRAIERVLVHRREGFSLPVFGALEEVRCALRRLVEAGKEVHYYAPAYQPIDCVLGAACSRRVLHPLGAVAFSGVARSALFFKRLLDVQGVRLTVIRRARFKSAGDLMRCDAYDAYARRQYQALLDGAVAVMRESLTGTNGDPTLARSTMGGAARGFEGEHVDAMLAGRVFTAPEALEAGLVDDLRTADDLVNAWKAAKAKDRSVRRCRGRFGRGPRVAVLVFEGMIVDGASRRDPLFGQAIGDRSMVRAIRALRENRRVKAVVFRINSGGGSATASENIVRELAALHAIKPLVISMGPVAGSGGYWISGTGRRLFALPTTVTGSIGVITLYFDLSALLERHGITSDCVKHGAAADLGSALRPMTDEERRTIDGVVEFLYQAFVERVATVRRTSPEAVREVAEGRVWLGRDAVERGLVDALGGLHDALGYAKQVLGAERVRVTFEPRQSRWARMLSRQAAAAMGGAPWVTGGAALTAAVPGVWPAASIAGAGSGGEAAEPLSPLTLVQACRSLHGRPLLLDPGLFGLALGEPGP